VTESAQTERIAAGFNWSASTKLRVNLTTPALYEEAIRRREGLMARGGSFVVETGVHTGRSPKDKYFVQEPSSQPYIDWGKTNRPISVEQFEEIHKRLLDYLNGKELFVQDLFLGADPRYRLPVRVVTEYAWHSLFARTLFVAPPGSAIHTSKDLFTIIDAPSFNADPEKEGTRSGVFIIINLAKKIVVIGGTSYAGEMKKSGFTIMNYLLPDRGVFPMHCSANVGKSGDVALFFGLSGTGKTTLSTDPERRLIGDDEHGWSEDGVFNFEGGCYAKMIRLSREAEPEIHRTTEMFGTVLENVVIDEETREIDLNDETLTENTRGAYPLKFIPNVVESGVAGHPKNIVFLTADAFGVMPPLAKLTPEQAMYHFLSGYTAKVAGTEKGLGKEPEATFSTCFGAPFLPRPPILYAEMLGERMKKHAVHAWLVNTGWSGGPFGVGERIHLAYTRSMIRAALNGLLNESRYTKEPFFGLDIPAECPGVPSEVLKPKNTWKDGASYDRAARELAARFKENFGRFANDVPPEVSRAGPMAE
jgi:phosphoenolpyruvate carboxykinase (ATP)